MLLINGFPEGWCAKVNCILLIWGSFFALVGNRFSVSVLAPCLGRQ